MNFTEAEIFEKLKTFVASKTQVIAESEIKPDTKLFSSGLLDSLAYIELVTFIESTFEVTLSEKIEVNVDNLDSIALILKALA